MGVPKKISVVESEMKEATDKSNYTYIELLPKTNPKKSYCAKVADKQGYWYSMRIGEIRNNIIKDPFRTNPFVKHNYLNYISTKFKDIVVENYIHENRFSLVYFHCNKHLEKGTQCMRVKDIRDANYMCSSCCYEYVGQCNSYKENDIVLISKILNEKNCDFLSADDSRSIAFRCRIHSNEIQKRSWGNICRSKTPCSKCNKDIQSNITRGALEGLLNHPRFDNERIEVLGDYVTDATKTLCICNYCNHQWYATPNKLKQGRGCPMCANQTRSVLPLAEVKERLARRYPTIEIIGGYVNTHTLADFKCSECSTVWKSSFQSIYFGNSGCPLCNSTFGEYSIAVYLNNNNIKYERQFSFDGCKLKNPLRFDFYLPDYNTVVEYQGEQHYYPVKFNAEWNDQELQRQFQYTQTRDDIKRNYCKEQGINMVEIPYWDKNNIEKYLDKIA